MIGKLWLAFVGDVIIATAISLYCLSGSASDAKGPDLLVDPQVAIVTWEDGTIEEMRANNPSQCHRIKTDVNVGVACRLLGATCGWQPIGREGVAILSVRCERR